MNFDVAFDRLLGAEGAYVNDPNDPGGETKWGISKRSYPDEDIANLTKERAKFLYRKDFWDVLGGDGLPSAVAFQTFDFAVSSGCSTAIRYLQRSLGVADDGHWGPKSLAAASSTSTTDTILRLNALRLDYMTRLENWPSFSRGWARRISANLLFGADDT